MTLVEKTWVAFVLLPGFLLGIFVFGWGRIFSSRVCVSTDFNSFHKTSLHSYLIARYKTSVPFLTLVFYLLWKREFVETMNVMVARPPRDSCCRK